MELTCKNLPLAEEDFNANGQVHDANVAFICSNRYGDKSKIVPSVGVEREIVLIDDGIYMLMNNREAKVSKNGRPFKVMNARGHMVLLLQFMGVSVVYNYKATHVLREWMLNTTK